MGRKRRVLQNTCFGRLAEKKEYLNNFTALAPETIEERIAQAGTDADVLIDQWKQDAVETQNTVLATAISAPKRKRDLRHRVLPATHVCHESLNDVSSLSVSTCGILWPPSLPHDAYTYTNIPWHYDRELSEANPNTILSYTSTSACLQFHYEGTC